MNCFARQKQRHRCREQTYGHQGGKTPGGGGGGVSGGGGVMNWEIGIDMYTLIGIIQITNKNLLYLKKRVVKDEEKLEPSHITGGNVKWCIALETIWQFLKILNIELPYDPPDYGVTANGYRFSFRGNKTVLKLVMAAQL